MPQENTSANSQMSAKSPVDRAALEVSPTGALVPKPRRTSRERVKRTAQEVATNPPPASPALAPVPPGPPLPFSATLGYAFRALGGKDAAINAALLVAQKDERFARLVTVWDQTSEKDRDATPLEVFCDVCDILPEEFMGAVTTALWSHQREVGKLIAAMKHPEIIAASADSALIPGKDGFKDRQMLLDAAGFLPAKGPLVSIDQRSLTVGGGSGHPGQGDGPSIPPLPRFEDDADEDTRLLRDGDEDVDLSTSQVARTLDAGEVLDAEIIDAHDSPEPLDSQNS